MDDANHIYLHPKSVHVSVCILKTCRSLKSVIFKRRIMCPLSLTLPLTLIILLKLTTPQYVHLNTIT